MFNRKPNPEKLDGFARQLHLRADQLDREGKHGDAAVKRKQATRLETKARRAREGSPPPD